MHKVVAAHRHHLGQRRQQLAAAATPSMLLEWADAIDGAVQPRHQVGAGSQLSGQEQAGMTGLGWVVGADLDVAGAGLRRTLRVSSRLACWVCRSTKPIAQQAGKNLRGRG